MDTGGGGDGGAASAAAAAAAAPAGPSFTHGLTLLHQQETDGGAAAASAAAPATDGRAASDFLADRLGGGGGVYSRARPAMPALDFGGGDAAATINPLSAEDVVKSPPPPEDMTLEITEEPRPVPASSALRALTAGPHPGAVASSDLSAFLAFPPESPGAARLRQWNTVAGGGAAGATGGGGGGGVGAPFGTPGGILTPGGIGGPAGFTPTFRPGFSPLPTPLSPNVPWSPLMVGSLLPGHSPSVRPWTPFAVGGALGARLPAPVRPPAGPPPAGGGSAAGGGGGSGGAPAASKPGGVW